MDSAVDALILDLLEWLSLGSRPYPEVLEAWRTSCPRLPVWEEANDRGFMERRFVTGTGPMISVSAVGAQFMQANRRDLVGPGARRPTGAG